MALSFAAFGEFCFSLFRRAFAFDIMGVLFVRFLPILWLFCAAAAYFLPRESGAKECMGSLMNDATRAPFLEAYCYAPLANHIFTGGRFHGYYSVMHWYYLVIGLLFFCLSELLFDFCSGVALSRLIRNCKSTKDTRCVIELVSAAFNWTRTAPQLNDSVVSNPPLVRSVSIANLSPTSSTKSSPAKDSPFRNLQRSGSVDSILSFVTASALSSPKEDSKSSYGGWVSNGKFWSSKQSIRLVLSVLGFKLVAVACCVGFVFGSDYFFGANVLHATLQSLSGGTENLTVTFPISGHCNITVENGVDLRREKLVCSLTANATFVVLFPVTYLVILLSGVGMLLSLAYWIVLLCNRKRGIIKATTSFLKSSANNDVICFASTMPADIWLVLKFLEQKNNAKQYNEFWGTLYREEVVCQIESLMVSTFKPKTP